MKFRIILPRELHTEIVDCKTLKEVEHRLGLPEDVDHGRVGVGLFIVVDGQGFKKPSASQSYFAIGNLLFAGNAVLYACDQFGKTVDISEQPLPISWLPSAAAVERNIDLGIIDRPAVSVNGEVIWEWHA